MIVVCVRRARAARREARQVGGTQGFSEHELMHMKMTFAMYLTGQVKDLHARTVHPC